MKHRGEHWTDEELTQLRTLYESGMRITEISSKINRSESGISKKIKELYMPNRRVEWTEEEIKKLQELHNQKKSYIEIASILGKSVRGCQTKAVRIGIRTKDCNVWKNNKRSDFYTESEVTKLKKLIEDGLAAKEIADSLGRSVKSIFYKMSELGLHIKEKTDIEKSEYRRHFIVDDDYFENIDTQKKAYFLGWLITDGWVTGTLHTIRNGNTVSNKIGLKLEISDLDVIQEFQKELKTDFPIKYRKARVSKEYTNKYTGKKFVVSSGEQCSLEITSAKMKNDLAKYGITPNKTYTVDFPYVLKEEFYAGFVAGVLSGDGSVDVKKNHGGMILRSSICGTEKLLAEIRKILIKNIGFNPAKFPKKTSSSKHLYVIELSQKETIKLYLWLKENGISIMSRKNRIIEDYIKSRPDLLEEIENGL